jgi:hypothetical protein
MMLFPSQLCSINITYALRALSTRTSYAHSLRALATRTRCAHLLRALANRTRYGKSRTRSHALAHTHWLTLTLTHVFVISYNWRQRQSTICNVNFSILPEWKCNPVMHALLLSLLANNWKCHATIVLDSFIDRDAHLCPFLPALVRTYNAGLSFAMFFLLGS